mmetsp:Transcript_11469/g.26203  ORF Transcript_11469/g.26203 Transcript_11469/m.26203 type:complete len:95 (+) Transcript_11469:813-1097(+)
MFSIDVNQTLQDALNSLGTSWDDFLNCNAFALNVLFIKDPLTCPSIDFPQTCHALPLLKAGDAVVDVEYSDVERSSLKPAMDACFVARFHSSCL